MNAQNKALRGAYKDFWQELSAVLYEVDPIGAAVGGLAPIDEYSHEAAILAASLCNVRSRDQIGACLNKIFGICSESFIDKVDKPLQKFLAHPAHQESYGSKNSE
jgi:hypothetical protein